MKYAIVTLAYNQYANADYNVLIEYKERKDMHPVSGYICIEYVGTRLLDYSERLLDRGYKLTDEGYSRDPNCSKIKGAYITECKFKPYTYYEKLNPINPDERLFEADSDEDALLRYRLSD